MLDFIKEFKKIMLLHAKDILHLFLSSLFFLVYFIEKFIQVKDIFVQTLHVPLYAGHVKLQPQIEKILFKCQHRR